MHYDFIKFIVKDLQRNYTQQNIALVKQEDLSLESISGSNMEEQFILSTTNRMAGLDPRTSRGPRNPSCLTSLIHWNTIAHIIKYASTYGVITGHVQPKCAWEPLTSDLTSQKCTGEHGILANFNFIQECKCQGC